jgi:prolipoprotein diacylglyceryltransferase
MVVSYVIGAILAAFGLAVIYESYSGILTTIRIYYYPALGTVLIIIGARVCYAAYMLGKSKSPE